MGSPTHCAHCGKRFKVFAKRRKCTHCHILLCRHCVDAHGGERHNHNGATSYGSSSNLTDASYGDDDDDVHFHSPQGAASAAAPRREASRAARSKIETSVDLLDDLDLGDVVDVEDQDDDDDDDDGNDEDLLLGEFSRRASMEEEETQFREFTQLQHAVEKYARAEIEISRQQRLAKQSSRVVARVPVRSFTSTRAYQQRELFTASYAACVTLAVWTLFAVAMVAYRRLLERTLPYPSVTLA